jgi:hypothetical protein
VILNLVYEGLFILQYADDTILFMDHNSEQEKNMKLLLSAFKQLSGFTIRTTVWMQKRILPIQVSRDSYALQEIK